MNGPFTDRLSYLHGAGGGGTQHANM